MKKIVIVDDNKDILENIKTILSQNEEYSIYDFNSSPEALEYINNNTADINLIITDITMPDMTGIELISKCNNIENIPVLFLTANQDNKTVSDAYKLHTKVLTINYLVKPFNAVIFLSTVSTLLRTQDYFLDLLYKNRKIKSLLENVSKKNEYLIKELNDILKNYKENNNKIERARSLIKNISNNDLPLIKFILKVVEMNKETVESIIGEGEEFFKVLPKTIEPLKTVISDITSVIEILVTIGILSYSDLEGQAIEQTTFYNIIFKIYKSGGFDTSTFEELLELKNLREKRPSDIIFFE